MSLWQSMGLEGKRALLLHHDDLGITHAQTQAYLDLGLPTGSVMAPSGWAATLASRPRADLGAHLTLTSEWAAPRLRALSGGESLADPTGYLWPSVEQVWIHARTPDAASEMRAQLEAVTRMGIDVTHIDTHMGAVLRPDIAEAYHALAVERGLPLLLPADLSDRRVPQSFRPDLERLIATSPMPPVTLLSAPEMPIESFRSWYLDTLTQLRPGVYHLLHHAALPTPEGQAIPDWRRRAADYDVLRDPDVRRAIGECVPLTYGAVREALRKYSL